MEQGDHVEPEARLAAEDLIVAHAARVRKIGTRRAHAGTGAKRRTSAPVVAFSHPHGGNPVHRFVIPVLAGQRRRSRKYARITTSNARGTAVSGVRTARSAASRTRCSAEA